jgi:hypothetical protein
LKKFMVLAALVAMVVAALAIPAMAHDRFGGQVPRVLYFPPSLISPLPLHEHHLLRLPLVLPMFC